MDGWGTEVKGERREGWEKSGKVTLGDTLYSSLTQANRTDRGEKELRNSPVRPTRAIRRLPRREPAPYPGMTACGVEP